MNQVINTLFDYLAIGFEKIPFLNKFKDWRTVIGLAGLIIVGSLQASHVGNPETLSTIQLGLLGFTGLALNAKGRP